jgi:hypothetical protein
VFAALDAPLAKDKILSDALRANVAANWPHVLAALDRQGILSRQCAIAAAATIGVETPRFAPIRERGGPAYFVRLYWTDSNEARELGNLSAEDAVAFCGRGFVQITGRANYKHFGEELKLDLVNNPNVALEPEPAAHCLALFFRERGIHLFAAAGNWERVRRRVNGGLNGWADFTRYVQALLSAVSGVSSRPERSAAEGSASPEPAQ